MWADTPDSWRAPGFRFSGSTNGYYYGYEPLNHVVDQLQKIEKASGIWVLAQELSPFSSISGRNYPVVLSFLTLDGQKPMPSKLLPNEVANKISRVFSN